jgi:hypothetical protein
MQQHIQLTSASVCVQADDGSPAETMGTKISTSSRCFHTKIANTHARSTRPWESAHGVGPGDLVQKVTQLGNAHYFINRPAMPNKQEKLDPQNGACLRANNTEIRRSVSSATQQRRQ